jgi:SAM-dependent methyltransferase
MALQHSFFRLIRKLAGIKNPYLPEAKRKAKLDRDEDDFYSLLFKIHTSRNRLEKYCMIKKAKEIASRIPYLKDWPNGSIFWDTESGMWAVNIEKDVREFVKNELKALLKKNSKNLCLGSGNYPYWNDSVLLDFSQKMLDSAPAKFEKVLFDLESKKKLPFPDSRFDSCTMIFVTNYLKSLNHVFKESRRVLKKGGRFAIINLDGFTSELYVEQEKSHHSAKELANMLGKSGFSADAYKKKLGNLEFSIVVGKKK